MPTTNPVPSQDPSDLLFNAGKLDEVVSGSNATYTDRLGVSRRTMAGIDAAADVVLGGLGYAPPVAYASGIAMTLTTQTVEYAGEVYAPKVANLPFTTSGTFETAKFRLIQGVASADLASGGGAAMVGYAPAGTGAVATTVADELNRLLVSVTRFGAVADCDSSSIVGDAKYNPTGGTNNLVAFQKAIDHATLIGGSVYIPDAALWYKIDGELTVTCGISGAGVNGAKLKFTNPGTPASSTYSLKITAANNAVFENFTVDFSCSADPTNWTGNYDNFTGRRGITSSGAGDNQIFRNIVTYNSFQAGLAFYGGATKAVVDNIIVNRCRGNFGDGIYISGNKKKVKVTNCKVYDFTRIGIVTDSPGTGNVIEDCVIDNCLIECGHHQSYGLGGGEFNGAMWLENTARSITKNCTAKNVGGRGFTVTTGASSLLATGYTECYSVVDSCVAENTGTAYIMQALGGVNANHRVVNCTAINCAGADILAESINANSSCSVHITNFYSEKSFADSQARVISAGADSASGKVYVSATGIKVKSDFNKDTFNFSGSSGHISTYSNSGEITYNIKDFRDANGIVINNKHGLQTGKHIFDSIDGAYFNEIKAGEMTIVNSNVKRLPTGASPINKFYSENTTYDLYSDAGLATNTDIAFVNCKFNIPANARLWIANNYASLNQPKKIVCRFTDCNFYKDFTGSTKYAIQFSVKASPNQTGILLQNTVFYNTATTGSGAYAIWFDAGYSSMNGVALLDNTVQYPYQNFTTPQIDETVIKRIALQ